MQECENKTTGIVITTDQTPIPASTCKRPHMMTEHQWQTSIARKKHSRKEKHSTHPSMSSISPSPLLRRLIDLDMLDDQVPGIKTLGIGIGFCVLEEADQKFGGLFGPAGAGDAELFA